MKVFQTDLHGANSDFEFLDSGKQIKEVMWSQG